MLNPDPGTRNIWGSSAADGRTIVHYTGNGVWTTEAGPRLLSVTVSTSSEGVSGNVTLPEIRWCYTPLPAVRRMGAPLFGRARRE